MAYLTADGMVTGREFFSITVLPDGGRVLRAQCEMDERVLIRDVFLAVDAQWRPIDAFVRLTVDGARRGSSWYLFGEHEALCEGDTAIEGRVSQRSLSREPIQSFGTHSLHNDAWTVGRLRQWRGEPGAMPLASYTTSVTPDGSTGPLLIARGRGTSMITDLGEESVTVPAGRFQAHHIRICVPGVDDFDVWAAGEDCLPVRLSSEGLDQSYELESVEGDWR
jgi:hypothetical protein